VEQGKLNVNSLTSSNNTALHIASKNGHLDVCKYLVEDAKPLKADILLKGLDNDTPSEAALEMGKLEECKYLKYHENRM
jgi:ankyrin repeat protein